MKVALIGGTGSFGLALAVRLIALGEDEIVIGSRDPERARAAAAELGGRATGATNEEAVAGVDLAVLAVNADAALETSRAIAAALGPTPLLSVASCAAASPPTASVRIPPRARAPSASPLQSTAPSAAGLHSIAAANLAGAPPDEDASCCGDDPGAKRARVDAGREGRGRARARRRPARERPHARGADRGDREPEPALQGTRRSPHHRPAVISIVPVEGLPEIDEGTDLGTLIAGRAQLEDGDVVVIAQKIVSKAEGRIVRLEDVEASDRARELAGNWCDPRESEVILRESKRIVRSRNSLVIAETEHGFVCASAGVDHSNAAERQTLVLLSRRPRCSVALVIRDSIGAHSAAYGRRHRHRLVRSTVPARHDRRRDRSRRPRAAARPARHGRPGRVDPPLVTGGRCG